MSINDSFSNLNMSLNDEGYHIFKFNAGSMEEIEYIDIIIAAVRIKIPRIIHECFQHILEHGSTIEGIFRINGSIKRINQLYNHLILHKKIEDFAEIYSIHDVCGVLKKYMKNYLSSINEIFTSKQIEQIKKMSEVVEDSQSVQSFKTAKEEETNETIDKFLNYINNYNLRYKNDFLIYSIYQLNKLQSIETKMTNYNYSIIFQPYLFPTCNLNNLIFCQEYLFYLMNNFNYLIKNYSNREIKKNRFSQFMDFYNTPTNKRLSNPFHKSTDLLIDQLKYEDQTSLQSLDKSRNSSYSKSSTSNFDSILSPKNDSILSNPKNDSILSNPKNDSTVSVGELKKSKRRSFINFFNKNLSIDDLLITNHDSNLIDHNQKDNLLKRNFSLRVKSRR
ncbi:hypothetical protein HYPBUDRAFT_11899 [Hyphopichia burtonii NRRL Y-1933]|uniref:Rho-GAP domain-containing protein n=1 Tax=Hyphopichia burtonii NRRL Y-1933 TaxID=984485 RepID=A0A1E4RJC6_9ASCO|nr:hypothetical protein HYPBUDRAFT_11899 [Hyphopichia burtonii NRRL Y-1933]ODV67321.1 hypothetical protein HYPBUDRAFT_11899 [Hyphopichia burtonii NRRL Y-1933]